MSTGKLAWVFFCFAALIITAVRIANVDYEKMDGRMYLAVIVVAPLALQMWAYLLARGVNGIHSELQIQKKHGDPR